MKREQITTAAIYTPGKAIFGTCLLDLTSKAWDLGINLTGADIRKAWPADTGGVWIEGACEDKHYDATGRIDN
jgi:hypothetical protein